MQKMIKLAAAVLQAHNAAATKVKSGKQQQARLYLQT
jgi:hypothetical protein